MSSHRRRLPLAALLTTLLVGVTGAAVGLGLPSSDQVLTGSGTSGAVSTGRAANPREFGVSVGSVAGLRPGGAVTISVRYTNPYAHRIAITTQQLRVSSPSSVCRASSVTGAWSPDATPPAVVLPAGKSKTVKATVWMASTAPNGCQSVAFAVSVNARAVKR